MKDRNATFRPADRGQYSAARHNLKEAIKCVKAAYKKKIEDRYPTRMRQGIQHITHLQATMPRCMRNLIASLPALSQKG